MNKNFSKNYNKSKKELDEVFGKIEKIEAINNSKYLRNVYIKDKKGYLYKTLINIRHIGNLALNQEICVKGVAIKINNIYKLISYKIEYNNSTFSTM
ncbi:hypothetical protein [Marinitoga lauensis]|uniref:hypothetical protein n=1 Tax=Marinitoga lauensis TaxID=2201189 RepID=UPI0010114F8A|nr:hypothetical protein [Marinitoga lauensis]